MCFNILFLYWSRFSLFLNYFYNLLINKNLIYFVPIFSLSSLSLTFGFIFNLWIIATSNHDQVGIYWMADGVIHCPTSNFNLQSASAPTSSITQFMFPLKWYINCISNYTQLWTHMAPSIRIGQKEFPQHNLTGVSDTEEKLKEELKHKSSRLESGTHRQGGPLLALPEHHQLPIIKSMLVTVHIKDLDIKSWYFFQFLFFFAHSLSLHVILSMQSQPAASYQLLQWHYILCHLTETFHHRLCPFSQVSVLSREWDGPVIVTFYGERSNKLRRGRRVPLFPVSVFITLAKHHVH